ncbi:hypothetical protein SS50377_27046 [Spironucleus salmonicida]|uniref:Uncharacterized protein n=1 Tax=Spironucleus salmonicida TaxID=348837 RepID=V6LV26_9EUKA|nr:hypothetical protein SS50377_27044 [Spironucleus salmonicida]KAH0570758.1 hypothetical protein SS50377_27046 [Spironucleus salmonicida]|eukprot:EST47554.1 Hypothetical protein SS50377_12537 [Spironucleus salmonicida]
MLAALQSVGVEAHTVGDQVVGTLRIENHNITVTASQGSWGCRISFAEGGMEFTVQNPPGVAAQDLVANSMVALPVLMLGKDYHPKHSTHQVGLGAEIRPDYVAGQRNVPDRQQHSAMPSFGVGRGDVAPFPDPMRAHDPEYAGMMVGQNHPGFGKIRRDPIHPDTSGSDGFKSSLDQKFMFL